MNDAPPPDKKNASPVWDALSLAWELGYTIAIPIVVLGFGGALLDKKFGTSPLLLLIGIFLSLLISGIAVYKKTKSIISK